MWMEFGGESPGPRAVGVGGDELQNGALVGEAAARGDGRAVVLVAACAGDALARHADGPRAHQLDGGAVGVQGLE